MALLTTIFRFEWYALVRNRMMLCSLATFTLVSLLAIHTGRHTMQHRLVQLDSIRAAYQNDFNEQWQQVNDTSAAGRKKAASAGMAAVVNHRLPQNALWTPQPLQALALGITDIQPFYHQVQTTVNYQEPSNIPVSNPVKLFAGNFDLSFVWLYLLPLIVITFCYPLYAEEKESGTAALLMVQQNSLRRIIGYKLLFRALVISFLVLLLNLAGIISAPGGYYSDFSNIGWCITTQFYVMVWCALSWLVVSFRFNSALTVLLLTGCWLLAVMIGPAIANIYVLSRYPVPLRTELASLQRHESEEIWAMPPHALVDSFNIDHPQYAGSINPLKDTMHGSPRFWAGYHYLLEKRVGRAAALVDSQLAVRNRYFEKLAAFDPVLRMQQMYSQLAGTSLEDYHYYRQQVTAFNKQWKAFLYPWQLTNTSLGPLQFRQFPVFRWQKKPLAMSHFVTECLLLFLFIVLQTAAGAFLFNRNEQR